MENPVVIRGLDDTRNLYTVFDDGRVEVWHPDFQEIDNREATTIEHLDVFEAVRRMRIALRDYIPFVRKHRPVHIRNTSERVVKFRLENSVGYTTHHELKPGAWLNLKSSCAKPDTLLIDVRDGGALCVSYE